MWLQSISQMMMVSVNYNLLTVTQLTSFSFYTYVVAVIGFAPDMLYNYSVIEGVDNVINLTVELNSGQLGREVVVILEIQSDTATSVLVSNQTRVSLNSSILTGGVDFDSPNIVGLTFGPSVSSRVVPVGIIDDVFFEEDIESFSAVLSTSVQRLLLNTKSVVVNITDTDSEHEYDV